MRLTSTSYVVLGLVDMLAPEATPYRLKQVMQRSVADFHPVPHTSFYVEPARLAAGGLLSERQEAGGRRRKLYALTDEGRGALRDWLEDPEVEPTQLRSPGMLKVFFGAEPGPIARFNRAHHEALLAYFVSLRERTDLADPARRALETGIAYHEFWVERWRALE